MIIRLRQWFGLDLLNEIVIRGGGLESLRQHLETIGRRPNGVMRVGQTIFIDVQHGKARGNQ